MNTQTKEALVRFTEAVEKLAGGTIHMIGLQTATEVIAECAYLRTSLQNDKTICESK